MFDEMHGNAPKSTAYGPVKGVHVNWSAPAVAGWHRAGGVDPGALPAYEVVTMIHSVRSWREFHGPIEMYTDTEGLAWLEQLGLDKLYDKVDVDVLSAVDVNIYNPLTYRALAKIFVLASNDVPMAWVDTDLYLRRPIEGMSNDSFVFAHYEAVDNEIYPAPDLLPDPNAAIYPGWDFSLPATNTAIAFFGSGEHRSKYVASALAFAAGNNGASPVHKDARLTFAEQRIAPFTARTAGIELRPVCATTWDPAARRWSHGNTEAAFHHTWRDKKILESDSEFARRYLVRQISELLGRYPDETDRLSSLEERGLFSAVLSPREMSQLIATGQVV